MAYLTICRISGEIRVLGKNEAVKILCEKLEGPCLERSPRLKRVTLWQRVHKLLIFRNPNVNNI